MEILAHSYLQNNTDEKTLICPMVDARRMEVYQCIYDADMKLLTKIEPRVLDDLSYFSTFEKSITFIGDGAEKYLELSANHKQINIESHVQEAKHQTQISYINFIKGNFENLVNFEPFYLTCVLFYKKIIMSKILK